MILLTGRLTAIEPLHLGSGVTIGTFSPTLSYIPARTLRGMLGNYLFHQDGKNLFRELCLSDDKNPGMWFKPSLPADSVASPLAIRWCKRCGRILDSDSCCPDDYQEGSRKDGFVLWKSFSDGVYSEASVAKSISTKCPIHPERHATYTAEEELSPYNVEAILAGTVFDFRAVVPKDYLDSIKDSLWKAGIFYGVGGFRTRGYGMVRFEFHDQNESVEEYVRRRSKEIDENSLMVLNSPTVLRKDGKYFVGLEEDVLNRYICSLAKTKGVECKFTLKRSHIGVDYVRGWRITQRSYVDKLVPALKQGCSAYVDVKPELAALLEVYGLGEMNHIHGDVYFTREVG
ncbi:MAG: RAMP superfamily CRISPR-associated protein [Thermoplasmata archaeon]